ncbi:MAG: prepilin-type N-terminal cleavage/methylation domain-containing protein [Verrucomicrobiota bacterium]
MKLTNTRNMKRKSGMTLLELTVVILVLLSLISILFIGARAWKKGSDRAGCILNIRNFQQAVRSYANMNQKAPGDTVPAFTTTIIGAGLFMENAPTCPGRGTYTGTGGTTVPAVGTLAITCSLSADPDTHVPANIGDW